MAREHPTSAFQLEMQADPLSPLVYSTAIPHPHNKDPLNAISAA